MQYTCRILTTAYFECQLAMVVNTEIFFRDWENSEDLNILLCIFITSSITCAIIILSQKLRRQHKRFCSKGATIENSASTCKLLLPTAFAMIIAK